MGVPGDAGIILRIPPVLFWEVAVGVVVDVGVDVDTGVVVVDPRRCGS
jgi:hypothetical protein